MRRHVLIVLAVTACTKAKEPRYQGPMPVVFGDCAGPKVAFVSGPKPLPFTPADTESAWEAPEKMAQDDPPPPEPDDPPPVDEQPAQQQAVARQPSEGRLVQGGAFASLIGSGDIGTFKDVEINGGMPGEDANIYGALIGNEAGEMNGGFGFGRSGFGNPNGPSGWGTIGTGRYIGHGSGTGYGIGGGRGGLRGRSANVPTVSIGQPNAQGDLDKAIIRRYIKRNIAKITYCYEKQLLANPKLEGTVQTQFFITPNGDVSSSSGSGVDQDVATCVAGVIKDIQFPKPKGGGVQVNYPFTFRPADDSSVTPPAAPPDTGSAAPDNAGSATTPPAGAGSAAPPAAGSAAPPPAGSTHRLFRDTDKPMPDASKYDPGAHNPLRAEQKDLTDCFRLGPNHYGATVVELTYDAGGKVTSATPHGVQHESARTCITKIAKRIKGPAGATQRCSISFGVMPVSALPTVEITETEIKLDGRALISMKDLEAQEAKTGSKIPSITDPIAARLKEATAASGPVVSSHGPLVIKPAPTTPMKHVTAVVRSILAGGDDFVLAAGNDWKLLTPLTLPMVPVPFGTGARWNHYKGRYQIANAPAQDERVVLSIYIQKDRIWIGMSRVNEFTELAADPAQLEKLAKNLAEQKKAAFFADREDVEIAADDEVQYKEFVKVVETAVASGFTAWQQTEPSGLSARPTM